MNEMSDTRKKASRMRAYMIALLAALAVMALGFWVQGKYSARQHVMNVKAANAHGWIRYVTTLFENEKDITALSERMPAAARRMMEADPRIREIQVLKGTRFLFHTDPAKHGQAINPEDERDKKTYDDFTQIKFRLKKNNIAEKYLLSFSKTFLTLVEPIMKGKRKSAGVVKLIYSDPRTASSGFLPILLTGLAVFIAALLLFRLLNRFKWLIAIPAVLLFMVLGIMLASGHAGSLWDNAYQQKSQHLDRVTQAIKTADPGFTQAYLLGLKKGIVKGFHPEFSAVSLDDTGALDIEPDTQFPIRQRNEFNRRTRTVSIAFLAMALVILGFIMAGYAWRTLSALHKHHYAYIYVFPAMVGMIVLVFFPFVYGMTMGFFKITHQSWEFVGLQNFVDILSDFHPFTPGNFYFTLGVTVMWTVINVALHVGIGLVLALVLNRPNLPLKRMYRVLLILPWAIPNYITALIWKGMFHKQFGAINAFLQVIGVEAVSWFNNFWTAFFANVATNTWLGFPFMMVISLGALQSIPKYLYEAAEVDGASKWQQFRTITLPLLKPALFPAIILGTIWTFNMFNIIYLVSNGAPNRSTDILITQAFRYAFEEFNWGFAAAYSIIIFLILLAYGTFSNRATKATEGVFD